MDTMSMLNNARLLPHDGTTRDAPSPTHCKNPSGQSAVIVKATPVRERRAEQRLDPASSPLRSLFDENAHTRHFQPNSTVLLDGELADAIYLVESGVIRCCTIDEQGKRQIFSFAQKGDFIGVSDFDRWHFTAEAVDHVVVKSLPRSTLEQELAVNASMRHEIRAHMRALLERREKQLLTLVTAHATERLFRFLEDFAAPQSGNGYVTLPMSRRDIGDHIGLSMESVSRSFGHLKREGRIDLKSHEKFRILMESGEHPFLQTESSPVRNCGLNPAA